MSIIANLISSPWIPDGLLFALTIVFRIRSGSWLAPSSFFGLYWIAALTTSLLAVDHRVPGLGTWVLVSLIVTVQLGSGIAETNGTSAPLTTDSDCHQATSVRLRKACLLFLLMALAGCVYFIWLSLDTFRQEFTLVSLVQMAAKWTFIRYADFRDPWPLRFAAVWVYPVALLGGMLTSASRKRADKVIGALSLLPALLLTFLAGGRTAIVLALAFWFGGQWAARVACTKGRVLLFGKGTLLLFAGLAMSLVLIFVGVNTFRGAKDTSNLADLSLEFNSGQIRNYMFGPPAAFVQWFDRSASSPVTWGALTLQGVFDVLQIRPRTLGTYGDSEATVGSEGTNIFTMFRGLIQDFTLPGAYLVCGLWGLFSGYVYSMRSLRVLPVLGLSAFYALCLFGGLICPLVFNSTIFTWVIAWLVLRRTSWRSSSSQCRIPGQPEFRHA